MTDPGDRHVTQPAGPATSAICPYLLAGAGGWRAATPSREHRCTAVQPPTPLAADKQRRLCLVREHRSCATFLAGAGLVAPDDRAPARVGALARPIARTTPVLYDHGRVAIAADGLAGARGVGQGGLVALMAVAFGALVAARLSGGGPDLQPAAGAGAAATPGSSAAPTSSGATAAPDPAPSAEGPSRTLVPTEVEPTPAATAAPEPSPRPSEGPDPTQGPSTYTVARGDSLSAIASRFGTTWQVLAELNDIADPRSLRVGQVLELP